MAKELHKITCLKAVEKLVGGRVALARRLNVSHTAIKGWFDRKDIPKYTLLALANLDESKERNFTVEDFLRED